MFSVCYRTIRSNFIERARCCCGTASFSLFFHTNDLKPVCLTTVQHNLQLNRFKSKKGDNKYRKKESSDSEDNKESDLLDEVADKNTKTLNINVTSMRIDAILKSSLGIARNKIETLFYESKIRVNGEKVPKKSMSAHEGDEVDIIKGVNINNPNFLTIARVEILAVTAKEDSISVKIRRFKSLTVDNYKDKWSP